MLSANDVASVIIARSGPWMDARSLQKLLYYVQAWHLAVTDEPLFEERIKAWKDGPVVPQVWHSRQDQRTRRAANQHVDDVGLDDLTSDLIDLVLGTYGSMSGEELSALTHVEQPWRQARGDLTDDAPCSEAIDPESMARYYRAHRRLGNRTAADLAAGGVHVRSHEVSEPVDMNAILDEIEDDDPGDDPWGSANQFVLESSDTGGIEQARQRAYSGA